MLRCRCLTVTPLVHWASGAVALCLIRFFSSAVSLSTHKCRKGILYLLHFLIAGTFFSFVLSISTSLLTLPTCSCMLSTFSFRVLSILVWVVFNSWCDNAHIPALSGSDDHFFSSNCLVLPLGMPCHFLLKAGYVYHRRKCCKKNFS